MITVFCSSWLKQQQQSDPEHSLYGCLCWNWDLETTLLPIIDLLNSGVFLVYESGHLTLILSLKVKIILELNPPEKVTDFRDCLDCVKWSGVGENRKDKAAKISAFLSFKWSFSHVIISFLRMYVTFITI